MAPFDSDFTGLEAKLRKKETLPAYLVWGDEPFFRDRALSRILRHLARGGETDHFVTRYDGEGDEKASLNEVLSDLATPSLFSPVKVAVFRRADDAVEKAADALVAFFSDPPDRAHLLLEMLTIDRRRKWAKAFKRSGGVVSCKKLYDRPPPWSDAPSWDNPLAHWTVKEAAEQGMKFSLEDAGHLIDRVGSGLRAIYEELGKLSLYLRADPKKPVTVSRDAVNEIVGDYNEYGLFKFTDAVAARRLGDALKIAGALFEHGLVRAGRSGVIHDPGTIATLLTERVYARIRELFQARILLDRGGGPDVLVKEMKKHKAFAPQLAKEARGFALADFPRNLGSLLQADLALKTGQGEARLILEKLILEILPRP
jgi:DNA polymerase-3 subunit delta